MLSGSRTQRRSRGQICLSSQNAAMDQVHSCWKCTGINDSLHFRSQQRNVYTPEICVLNTITMRINL
ncbi:hypothetical protein COOONC_02954 [Cooperia oncophora]